MSNLSLSNLTKQVISFRNKRNWKQYPPKSSMLSLFVEAGELAEHFQYLDGEELEDYIEKFRKDIGEEMSDVLYWLLIMSHDLEIDLEDAFLKKMKKNGVKYPEEISS